MALHLEVVFVSFAFPPGTERNRIIANTSRRTKLVQSVWALADAFLSRRKCVNEIKLYTAAAMGKIGRADMLAAANMNKLENTHSVNGLSAQRSLWS